MAADANEMSLEKYRRMVRIREFETWADKIHANGEIPGGLHTCTGQEGAIVGACAPLKDTDYMVGTHRSHGHPIAKGANVKYLMAELMGKETGVCRGKGGSMHLSDFSVGSLGETSIVGSGVPVAVGAALGAKMQKSGKISLCFFGDGASNEGAFHEGVNLASVWKLPVIFFCENNLYAVSTPASAAMNVEDVAIRAQAYGIPGVIVDGQDVDLVEEAVKEAIERAQNGEGPTLIEAKTYRYSEHASNMGRTFVEREEEIKKWRERDPILLYRKKLVSQGISSDQIDAIDKEVKLEVEQALEFARESNYPDNAEAFEDVFTEKVEIPENLTL